MSKKHPFVRDVYTCQYRFKCGCYCALSVKTFSEKVEVALAGEHTPLSHSRSSGILSVKQRAAVKHSVRSSPHMVGSQVHAELENFSPGKRVPFDSRSHFKPESCCAPCTEPAEGGNGREGSRHRP